MTTPASRTAAELLHDCAESLRGYRRECGDEQPCDAERAAFEFLESTPPAAPAVKEWFWFPEFFVSHRSDAFVVVWMDAHGRSEDLATFARKDHAEFVARACDEYKKNRAMANKAALPSREPPSAESAPTAVVALRLGCDPKFTDSYRVTWLRDPDDGMRLFAARAAAIEVRDMLVRAPMNLPDGFNAALWELIDAVLPRVDAILASPPVREGGAG